jgi:hypothetical protein
MFIQAALLVAIQLQPAEPVTVIEPSPPMLAKDALEGESGLRQRTGIACENSEVLPFGLVAVAVKNLPDGSVAGSETVKLALQALSVTTVVEPMKLRPSPKPEGSCALLEKN